MGRGNTMSRKLMAQQLENEKIQRPIVKDLLSMCDLIMDFERSYGFPLKNKDILRKALELKIKYGELDGNPYANSSSKPRRSISN